MKPFWRDAAAQTVGTLTAAAIIYVVAVISGVVARNWVTTLLASSTLVVVLTAAIVGQNIAYWRQVQQDNRDMGID